MASDEVVVGSAKMADRGMGGWFRRLKKGRTSSEVRLNS
jgi:hypothetical protein